MPTYDYICENCECKFEQFQSIVAKPLRKCPECKKLKLKRLIGAGSGIIFKGSGFYQTDYRSDGYKKSANSEKPAKENTKTEKTEKKEAKTQDSKSPTAAKKSETKNTKKSK
ncbi:MAG: zinc ribbon domain-containing protein [Planctomycetes bacterium]|nr:zinc ribbon domain-containing protein [Planctomycetota bacterium]MCK5472659.1 zinc ribbon domain-containing protein [Planctomycetota bacterium]